MKSLTLKLLLLLCIFSITYQKLRINSPTRELQEEEEEYEEEEDEEYEEDEDEYTYIETYQRRSIRIGKQSSIYKIFLYHVKPIKGKKGELIIDLATNVFENIKLYIYTIEENIYYNPRTNEFEDADFETDIYSLNQITVTEDFLESEIDLYIVFFAPDAQRWRTYVTINLENELFDVYEVFRYTYYNNKEKQYYFYINPGEEKRYMYVQFQSLVNDPSCSMNITTDEDFENVVEEIDLSKKEFKEFYVIKPETEYYVVLKLGREGKASHDFNFDISFLLTKYDKPYVTTFYEKFSSEFPIIVSQSVYFFIDVSNLNDNNIIIRGNNLGEKITQYSYEFINEDTPDDAAGNVRERDFERLNDNRFSASGIDVYLKIPRSSGKILALKIDFNAVAANIWDTIDRFYFLKLLPDSITYGNLNLEQETLMYISPNDFKDGNVLIISTSAQYAVNIIDFEMESSDESVLKYLNYYKDQYYIFTKETLPNEILLVLNEQETYCQLQYQFFDDIEILSSNFDSYGRLFSLNDCSKTYFLFSSAYTEDEETNTFIYYRRVYGDASVYFGKIHEYTNDIDALFSQKYTYDGLTIFNANSDFFVKLTCTENSEVHLIYFDSTNSFSADNGNFYPLYLDSKRAPYEERTLEVISRNLRFEIELIKDPTQYVQSFELTFMQEDYEFNLQNPKHFFEETITEDEQLEFYNIKGKSLVFFKIDLDEEDYKEYTESTTITKLPENKVLVFPFQERFNIQTFKITNPNDRTALICLHNDFSRVYIHPRGGSCFYLENGKTRELVFQFGNLFRSLSTIGDEQFYTVIFMDEDLTIDYKIEEGEDPGYDDSEEEGEYEDPEEYPDPFGTDYDKTTMNILLFAFLIIVCFGIVVIIRITKFQDINSEMSRYTLDSGNIN